MTNEVKKPLFDNEECLKITGTYFIRKSARLSFRCPFHNDTDPSAAFYDSSQKAHCFSCKYILTPIEFYARHEQMSREKARAILGRTYDVGEEGSSEEVKLDNEALMGITLQCREKVRELESYLVKNPSWLLEGEIERCLRLEPASQLIELSHLIAGRGEEIDIDV